MRGYLKELRNKTGLSQTDVARALTLSQQYYSLIENGERQQSISLELIRKLSDIFGVPVNELINEEDKYARNRPA